MYKIKIKDIAVIGLMMAIFLTIFGYLLFTSVNGAHAYDLGTNSFYGVATSKSISCTSGTSTLLLATSTPRMMIRISNLSAGSMYLGIGQAAATSSGVYLAASSTVSFDSSNVNLGSAIYCLTDSTTAKAAVLSIP